MKPTSSKVLVQLEITPELSKSGLIHIPEMSRTRSTIGTVVATGPQVKELKKGDKVLVPEFGGVLLEDKQKLFLEEEVFGVFQDA